MAFDKLTSPFSLRSVKLRNRIVMTPLTRGRATRSGKATPMMAEHYAQRASAGLIVSEGTSVSKQGMGWYRAPGIYTEEQAISWRQVTSAVHGKGGKIFCQLWHTGRASHSSFREADPEYPGDLALGVAPSAVKKRSETGTQMFTMLPGAVPIETPRALTIDEITDVIGQFRNAARLAKEAGFDGVEVHAAAGYLLDEFLQTCSNFRDDSYGGSVGNRFRIVREIVHAVHETYDLHRIGVRLSPNGAFNGMGCESNFEDHLYFAKELESIGVGYLHLVIGTTFEINPFHGFGKPMKLADFRAVFSGAIIGNAGFNPNSGEAEIANGTADAISFGRLFISNPDLVERIKNGWKLNHLPSPAIWFSTADKDLNEEGYNTFVTYEETQCD